jgi:hypothetical protein
LPGRIKAMSSADSDRRTETVVLLVRAPARPRDYRIDCDGNATGNSADADAHVDRYRMCFPRWGDEQSRVVDARGRSPYRNVAGLDLSRCSLPGRQSHHRNGGRGALEPAHHSRWIPGRLGNLLPIGVQRSHPRIAQHRAGRAATVREQDCLSVATSSAASRTRRNQQPTQ